MRRYLIVDDNRAFAENLAEILEDDGAEVTVVAGGAEAIEAARKTKFDALITDMRMPVMSGARLVHEIRAVDPGLPAIVVTAYTGEDDLTAARDEGLLAVLPRREGSAG
jgi:CheY-like chemotaxis protein